MSPNMLVISHQYDLDHVIYYKIIPPGSTTFFLGGGSHFRPATGGREVLQNFKHIRSMETCPGNKWVALGYSDGM